MASTRATTTPGGLGHELPLTEPRPLSPQRELAEFPGYAELVGVLTGVTPFFMTLPELERGVVIDWIALGGGALTLLLGVWSALLTRRTLPVYRAQRLFSAVALMALGGYHLLRGFGLASL